MHSKKGKKRVVLHMIFGEKRGGGTPLTRKGKKKKKDV